MHGPLSIFDPRLKEGAAYGFARIHSNGQLDLWHNGDTFLFHTGLHLLPEQNLGFFISNNGSEGSGLEAAVYKAFMDHYFSTQTEQEPVPPSNMASRAAQYAGEYYSSRANFTGIEKIMGLFAHAQISVDADGYVLIPSQGGAKKAVEVEPGLLQSVDDPWKQIVMETNAKGQNYLTAGTASLIKARWYETQAFHFSVLGISLLVLLFTLIGWVVASIVRRIKKREPQSLLPRLARNNGVAFILLMVAFIIGLIVVLSKSDPALGIPLFLFEVPVGLRYVLIIPFIAVMAGIGMLGFSALAWIKHFWTLVGRLHYTLATLAAWAMLLELVYWNFLKL